MDIRYHCYVCGKEIGLKPVIPVAPNISQVEVKCEECGNSTHLLLTSCPKCKQGIKYFLSDLDFPEEVARLSGAYVSLISGIRNSLKDVVEEFDVELPKRWSAKLVCGCGERYTAEITLPQLDEPK
jgi:hypothetical protein